MATPPPSQFAALLRQSRFASYDPKIGQVYASFGGHAHRGNWGLKRPLPLRRRKGNVTVQAVDSRYQQTEWKSAEMDRRWAQMWEEVGVTPDLPNNSPWSERLGATADIKWEVDSEFGLNTRGPTREELAKAQGQMGKGKKEETVKGQSEAVPNIYAMSDKQFERYLSKLRKTRPAFWEFLEDVKAKKDEKASRQAKAKAGKLGIIAEPYMESTTEPQSLWMHSRKPVTDDFKAFLMEQAYAEYTAPGSHLIEQRPQRYGGLVYAKAPLLQSYLLTGPQPGRVLTHYAYTTDDYVASFAGTTSYLRKRALNSMLPLNWRSLGDSSDAPDAMRGAAMFRLTSARLVAAPTTVPQVPAGLRSARIETDVIVPSAENRQGDNPYPPGSREYVAYQGHRTSMMTPVKPQKTSKPNPKASFDMKPGHAGTLVDQLYNLIAESHLRQTGVLPAELPVKDRVE